MTHTTLCPITETYYDVEGLIHQTIRAYRQRYGGDYEELTAVANQAFMAAYRTYDGDAAAFTTWVKHQVWYGLLAMQRKRPTPTLPTAALNDVPERAKFSVKKLMLELSQDAAEVVKLVIKPPFEMVYLSGKQQRVSQVRRALVLFLRELGWTPMRIVDTFREIKEALG